MYVLARAALNFASLLIVGSLLMLAATRSGTAPRDVSLAALAGGVAALTGTIVLMKVHQRRVTRRREHDTESLTEIDKIDTGSQEGDR
ncbi:hypothetical protein BIV57_06665 [Mangrovactinospora gilvigrisea]|uniref:Uncharacterized protein n=1 Tax=Mangrovactinospora gilvigrisea TaxID=1428644 RepID=A0A1J7BIB9_9ACTN|nr:hypothetical protein [Mangrovactinospora gilvigrisea]OIV38333.1 hypothetical protein BIV57_06665 [Mangrovactinospora gilvigrisea]